MCGRYFFKMKDTLTAYHALREKIKQMELFDYQEGEVFPSQKALVLVQEQQEILPSIKKWGIQGYKGNLLINARSEGVEDKITFRPMLRNRCVILANGFYEWVKQGNKKDKIAITNRQHSLMYFAGIYNQEHQFVIVTGASQHEMSNIHSRTPIILNEEEMKLYLQGKYPFVVNNEDLRFEKVEKKENLI